MMELIEVDPVGLQPSQARLDGRHDVAARRTSQGALVVHGAAKLGCEDDILPARTEDLTEQALRSATPAVAVRRIEQRDADVKRLVNDGAGLFEIATDSKIVASQPDRRDEELGCPKGAIVHLAMS